MTKRFLPMSGSLAVVALAAALLAAACNGNSAAPSETAAGVVATPAGAVPSAAASVVPSAGASAPLASFGIPGLNMHAAPDLESMLPNSVAGAGLLKFSFSLAQVSALSQAGIGGDAGFQTFTDWIRALGKNPGDVNMALATSLMPPTLTIGAIRVNGTDQGQLLSSFVNAATSQSGLSANQATIGGKAVVKVVDSTGSSPRYAYAKNDVLFFVQAQDDATAAAAMTALP